VTTAMHINIAMAFIQLKAVKVIQKSEQKEQQT